MKAPSFGITQTLLTKLEEFHTDNSMNRPHYHDTYEIYLQLEGERFLILDNEEYLLKKGSMFIINPFVMHMSVSAENPYYKRYLLNFSPSDLGDVLSAEETDILMGRLDMCVMELDETQFETARLYFNHMYAYQQNVSEISDKLMRMSTALLLDMIGSAIKKQAAVILANKNKNNDSPIFKALAYINSNYEKKITLDFISHHAHMSKSNFCLAFKKIIGDTFVSYLNTLRVSQVHRLLYSTDLPLKEIAERTGFENADYMSRAFKKVHSVSPSKFRKKFE